MNRKTLSVVIANYNHSAYLTESLNAAVSQSFQPKEIIVIDDCSTDESVLLIESFAKKYNLIKLLRNEKNMGTIFSANRGLMEVSSDYVFFMSADDFILPSFFEKSMAVLERYPQAGLCCSDPAQFFQKDGIILENRLRWSDGSCYFNPEEFTQVIQGWYISGHTTLVNTSILKDLGGFKSELKWHCDWFIWHVIAARFGVCYVPEPLAIYRVSQESYSSAGRRRESEQLEILENILGLLKSPAYRDVLPFFIQCGLMSHFGSTIVKAVMNNPKYWDAETILLIQNQLWKWNEESNQHQITRQKSFEQSTKHLVDK